MKTYNSNYLGIVIDNNDPEYRGRVQIFIPHIMPALYDDWNKEGKDITISCVGDNLQNSLDSKIVNRLKQILPWAEAASPIIGASAPGGVVGSRGSGGSNQFIQSPTASVGSLGSNGTLDQTQLTDIGGGHKVHPYVAQKFAELKEAAARDGVQLGITDSYRPLAVQESIVDQAWLAQTGQYRKKGTNGKIPVARPGTSNHGLGLALDLGGSGSTSSAKAYEWLKNNAVKYGWSNYKGQKADPGIEPWHWQINADEIPSDAQSTMSPSVAPPAPNPVADPNAAPSVAAPASGMSYDPSAGAITGTVSGGGTVSDLKADEQGRVDPIQLKNYVKQRLETTNSSLLNKKFPEYGIPNGSSEEWGNFFAKLAEHESGYNVKPRSEAGESDPGGSYGLFQVSPLNGWTRAYKANPAGRDWTIDELRDPANNTNTAIKIFESNLSTQTTMIQTRGGVTAGVGYFALSTMSKIKRDIGDGKPVTFAEPSTGAPSVIGNTYGYGRPSQSNTNDMASGLFAFPNVGAMVWVFFREGNPLFPVYFAASYSSGEWQSAYRGASLNPTGTNTGNPKPGVISNSTIMNFQGGAGFETGLHQDTNDPLNSAQWFAMKGGDGSQLTFRSGIMEEYAKNDKASFIDGNLWNVAHGSKETWIGSNSNMNCIGNSTEFYGKWDQESMEASKKLADMSFKYNQQLKSSNG